MNDDKYHWIKVAQWVSHFLPLVSAYYPCVYVCVFNVSHETKMLQITLSHK